MIHRGNKLSIICMGMCLMMVNMKALGEESSMANEGGTSDESMQKITKASADVKGALDRAEIAGDGVEQIIRELGDRLVTLAGKQYKWGISRLAARTFSSKSDSAKAGYIKTAQLELASIRDRVTSYVGSLRKSELRIEDINRIIQGSKGNRQLLLVNEAIRLAELAERNAKQAEAEYKKALAIRKSTDVTKAFLDETS